MSNDVSSGKQRRLITGPDELSAGDPLETLDVAMRTVLYQGTT
jgi:hypothetical protein